MAADRNDSLSRGYTNSEQGNTANSQGGQGSRKSFYLRLFVTGSTSRSQQAIRNIQQICEDHLKGKYELEVIDVAQDPDKAREHQILAVPTLLKDLPPPLRKIVGDLSEKEKVLEGLDVQPQDQE